MKKTALRAWLYVFIYAALLFASSSFSWRLPIVQKAEKIHLDWFVHAVEYGLFGALLAAAFAASFKFRSALGLIIFAGLVGGCYGVTDEWHQSFTPERDPNAADAAVDLAGALAGASIWAKKNSREFCIHA